MKEINEIRISVLIHLIFGISMGYLSFIISKIIGNMQMIFLGLASVILLGYVLERFLGKKGLKWWLGNGLIFYLFFWFITWTFFYNL